MYTSSTSSNWEVDGVLLCSYMKKCFAGGSCVHSNVAALRQQPIYSVNLTVHGSMGGATATTSPLSIFCSPTISVMTAWLTWHLPQSEVCSLCIVVAMERRKFLYVITAIRFLKYALSLRVFVPFQSCSIWKYEYARAYCIMLYQSSSSGHNTNDVSAVFCFALYYVVLLGTADNHGNTKITETAIFVKCHECRDFCDFAKCCVFAVFFTKMS